MSYDVLKIRADFPMLSDHIQMQGKDLVWLDNASTTFKPRQVIDAITSYYTHHTANSHRGDYDLCFDMDSMILRTREAAAKFINANPNEIVFTSGTTNSLNLIASAYGDKFLQEGDEIILTVAEHASNLLPWFELAKKKGCVLKYIPLDKEGKVTVEAFKQTITNKTKLVSLAQVTNVLGFEVPIKEIAKITHEYGAVISVDGAQSVPHMKVDVKDLDCDFLSFSAHKMCGPTGMGILYGKYELLQAMDPYMVGGGNNVKFYENGDASYLDAPMKFESGTLNLAGICGLFATFEYISKLGMDNIVAYERELKQYAIKKLEELDNVTIYNKESPSGIIAFNIKDVFAQDAATFLNSKGIACRSGQHCAKILNGFLGTVATVRASLYFYTTKEEIDALVEAVKQGGNYLDAYFN